MLSDGPGFALVSSCSCDLWKVITELYFFILKMITMKRIIWLIANRVIVRIKFEAKVPSLVTATPVFLKL